MRETNCRIVGLQAVSARAVTVASAALLAGSLLLAPAAGATGSADLGSADSASVDSASTDSGSVDTLSADLGSAAKESLTVVPEIPGPPQSTHAEATRYDADFPGSVPPGVNDFGCKPTAAHPNPVILAHGTDATAYSDYSAIGPRLKADGYCVFAVNYGGKQAGKRFGTEDMNTSAAQVAAFVERVRTSTGAAKVDLVGYSQGATVTRMFVNRLGGAAVVDKWVGIASPTYGGVFYGLVNVANVVPGSMGLIGAVMGKAYEQQVQGSDWLNALNAGGDTVPGVSYTTIGTEYDEMIQPYTNIALRDPGARNILIQDSCAQNKTGHMNMVYDQYTMGLVSQALDPSAPAPRCESVPLGTGMLQMMIASNSSS
ncbi:esterase/lipase family protein [Rhodococcus kronopolitis]|uniref:Esterase/lipase family protein n=1 Tax=Rhodococcus kronopolitis TaxID=1460226 RepID=A0ABV9FU53_9NOCA